MATRSRVLSAFKEIHRTCQSVYAGDRRTLRASRWKINTEFRRFKNETAPKRIENQIQLARDASRLIRLTAVQGESEDRSVYARGTTTNTRSDAYPRWTPNSYPQSGKRPQKSFQKDSTWFHDDPYTDYSGKQQPGKRHQKKYHQDSTWFEDDAYVDHQRRPKNWKKSRHVDSSNFDFSRLTGKRR